MGLDALQMRGMEQRAKPDGYVSGTYAKGGVRGGEKYAGEVVVINGSSILPTFPSSRGEYVASLSTLTDSRSSASFNEFLSLLSFRGDATFEIPRFSRFKISIDSLQIFYNFCVFLIFLVHNFPR